MRDINIPSLLPNSPDNETIQQIWNYFCHIADDLKRL